SDPSPPSSPLDAGAVEERDLAHLDRSPARVWIPPRECDRLRPIRGADEGIPADELLRLGERSIGHHRLRVAPLDAHRNRVASEWGGLDELPVALQRVAELDHLAHLRA